MRTLALIALAACGGSSSHGDDTAPIDGPPAICLGMTCSGHGTCVEVGGAATCDCAGGFVRDSATTCVPSVGPTYAGCPMFPANHIFNTAIDALPVDPASDSYIAKIGGTRKLHLDLGTTVDQQANDFYGIPINIVHGAGLTWPQVAFFSADPDVSWNDPAGESDCGKGAGHAVDTPCRTTAPLLPIPADVIVEGGISTAVDQLPAGDHHILLLDADSCRLWETYHSYSSGGTWNIYGAASFDMTSNALRPDQWTSADAAGFPIMPLLLRADEASTGEIKHALRFTITSSKIKIGYIWPARHLTTNGTMAADEPPMGQLLRLKASFVIPSNFGTQSKAILQAMKTYGMYLADGGSDMYVSGAASADWADETFGQVQGVAASNFEAVDITSIKARAGFDDNSAAVP